MKHILITIGCAFVAQITTTFAGGHYGPDSWKPLIEREYPMGFPPPSTPTIIYIIE
jgi:hypothetical protein